MYIPGIHIYIARVIHSYIHTWVWSANNVKVLWYTITNEGTRAHGGAGAAFRSAVALDALACFALAYYT